MEITALPWELIGRILLSALLGGIVGVERDLSSRPAGLRTNMIIAVSSCLFTLLSIDALGELGDAADRTRIASQIVTGVGFLGAGALLHQKDKVLGLTTAADIWLVAAIGMAVGAGWYGLSVFVTLLIVCAITLLAPFSRWLETQGKNRLKRKRGSAVKSR